MHINVRCTEPLVPAGQGVLHGSDRHSGFPFREEERRIIVHARLQIPAVQDESVFIDIKGALLVTFANDRPGTAYVISARQSHSCSTTMVIGLNEN